MIYADLDVGVPSLDVLARATPQLLSLPMFDTAASRAVHALMDMVRRQRGRFLPLQVSCSYCKGS